MLRKQPLGVGVSEHGNGEGGGGVNAFGASE